MDYFQAGTLRHFSFFILYRLHFLISFFFPFLNSCVLAVYEGENPIKGVVYNQLSMNGKGTFLPKSCHGIKALGFFLGIFSVQPSFLGTFCVALIAVRF